MAENTKIEWAHHTFNAWTGCAKISPGCAHCYAESWAKRSGLVVWGEQGTRRRTSEAIWRDVLRWNARAKENGVRERVFVNSLADWAEDRPELEAIRRDMFALIGKCEALDFLLLTKRPENFWKFLPWCSVGREGNPSVAGKAWPNVWLGVTAENHEYADERIPYLLRVPAAVRFISAEPLLGEVRLDDIRVKSAGGREMSINALDKNHKPLFWTSPLVENKLDLVIVGGESGHGARPMHPDWVRSLRDQCVASGTKFFFKQWGEWWPISQMPDHHSATLYYPAPKRDPEAIKECRVETAVLQLDGSIRAEWPEGAMQTFRVGKKAAGRLLDGREWHEMPEVTR